ncbi:MAG: tetratricopeptide repeat protein [Polyangiales bacterium]
MRSILIALLVVGCSRSPKTAVAPSKAETVASSCPVLGEPSGRKPSAGCSFETNESCSSDCDAGSEGACFFAALAAEDAGDDAKSRELYQRACVGGLAIACTNLGAQAFTKKNDLAPDCALSLFESACAQGEPFGCGMAGRVFAEGFGRKADPARARALLEAACDEHGHFPCHFLGIYLAEGRFGAVELPLAKEKLARACETKYPPACKELAKLQKSDGSQL